MVDPASIVPPIGQSLQKKRRIRVLTDERRRQNRDAQRRFRERRKCAQTSATDHAMHTRCEQLADDGTLIEELDLLDPSLDLCLGQSEDQDTLFDTLFTMDSVQPSMTTDCTISTLSPRPTPPLGNRTSQPAILPSPQLNYLQIQKLNFYAARIQNALHLGLPLFLASKEEEISPWYWHTQFSMLLCTSEEAVDESFSSCIPRPIRRRPCFNMSQDIIGDLAPTPLQRSHPHSMYLDMIPFPVFRDRAITLLAMDPPAFHESELKRDIEDDGLMVWGVGNGSVDRTATLVRDRRNWECSKRFSRKWRLLVHGSGLDEQSQWWRRMRGED